MTARGRRASMPPPPFLSRSPERAGDAGEDEHAGGRRRRRGGAGGVGAGQRPGEPAEGEAGPDKRGGCGEEACRVGKARHIERHLRAVGVAMKQGEPARKQRRGACAGADAARRCAGNRHHRKRDGGLDERQRPAGEGDRRSGGQHGEKRRRDEPQGAAADLRREQARRDHGEEVIKAVKGMREPGLQPVNGANAGVRLRRAGRQRHQRNHSRQTARLRHDAAPLLPPVRPQGSHRMTGRQRSTAKPSAPCRKSGRAGRGNDIVPAHHPANWLPLGGQR